MNSKPAAHRSSRRMSALVASVGLLSGLFYLAMPASPALACVGDTGQTSILGSCPGEDGGQHRVEGYDNPMPGTTWVKYETFGMSRTCIDSQGNNSYWAWMYGMKNGQRVTDNLYRCVVQHYQLVDNKVSVEKAKILLKPPAITSDYKAGFLTGAMAKFDTEGVTKTQRRAIPDSNAYIEGRPVKYEWDFGDGSEKATLAEPTHIYASKDGAKDGKITVTLTITYDAFLVTQDDAEAVEDQNLGQVPVQSTLVTPISESYAALIQKT